MSLTPGAGSAQESGWSLYAAANDKVGMEITNCMTIESGKAAKQLLAALREICATLSGAEEYVMVHHPAFRVGKKPFAIAGMDEATKGATVSINWGVDAQRDFLADPRFERTHYIGQHGWVTVAAAKLEKGDLSALVTGSWRRVAGKKHLTAEKAAHAPPSRRRRGSKAAR